MARRKEEKSGFWRKRGAKNCGIQRRIPYQSERLFDLYQLCLIHPAAVRLYGRQEVIPLNARILPGEHIGQLQAAAALIRDPEIRKRSAVTVLMTGFAQIEVSQYKFVVGQMPDEEIRILTGFSGQLRRTALLVLIDGDQLFVEHQRFAGLVDGTEVAAHHQRYAEKAPQSKVRPVFHKTGIFFSSLLFSVTF